jgi:carbohydrate-selective porin OprB
VKPDLQWVFDPSGDPSVEDALVGSVRCIWTF